MTFSWQMTHTPRYPKQMNVQEIRVLANVISSLFYFACRILFTIHILLHIFFAAFILFRWAYRRQRRHSMNINDMVLTEWYQWLIFIILNDILQLTHFVCIYRYREHTYTQKSLELFHSANIWRNNRLCEEQANLNRRLKSIFLFIRAYG